MSDRTDKRTKQRSLAILCALAILTQIPWGCATSLHGENPDAPQTKPASKKTSDKPSGDSRKFQPSREVAPEDVEAFQNALDQISRLEYGPAESEIRILLVRFESVDDPKYVSEALFWLGYCCEKQGVIDQARDYYQRVVEHYENTRPGRLAAQRLKRLPAE